MASRSSSSFSSSSSSSLVEEGDEWTEVIDNAFLV